MSGVNSFQEKPARFDYAESINKVNEAAVKLLNCGNDIGAMKQAVDDLYGVFRSISSIGIDDQNTPDIFLPSGKAISPEKAAHCLLEMKRTAVFIRGIHAAINRCIADGDKRPVKILYVGTGPYGTLMVPLLTLYTYEQVQVDLVEVNKISLNSVMEVFKELELFGFVERIFFSDAATLNLERKYDIVVAEVMQAALKKEPQVAVMQNLIPQLNPDAIFIPEAITIEAALVSTGKLNPETYSYEDVQRISLGEILAIDRNHLDVEDDPKVVQIPNNIGECRLLNLYTTIRVFDEHVLGEGDCSLTLPLRIGKRERVEGEVFTFWYEKAEVPGIRYLFSGSETVFEAFTRNVYERNTDRIEKL